MTFDLIPGDPPDDYGKGWGSDFRRSVDWVFKYLLPELVKIGWNARFRIGDQVFELRNLSDYRKWTQTFERISSPEHKLGSGLLLYVFDTAHPEKQILVQPWVRRPGRKIRDYPRFHLTAEVKELEYQYRIPAMLEILRAHKIAFFVLMLYGSHKNIWIGFFHNIDKRHWMLTKRDKKKSKTEDRMSIRRNTYDPFPGVVNIRYLKRELNKIMNERWK